MCSDLEFKHQLDCAGSISRTKQTNRRATDQPETNRTDQPTPDVTKASPPLSYPPSTLSPVTSQKRNAQQKLPFSTMNMLCANWLYTAFTGLHVENCAWSASGIGILASQCLNEDLPHRICRTGRRWDPFSCMRRNVHREYMWFTGSLVWQFGMVQALEQFCSQTLFLPLPVADRVTAQQSFCAILATSHLYDVLNRYAVVYLHAKSGLYCFTRDPCRIISMCELRSTTQSLMFRSRHLVLWLL